MSLTAAPIPNLRVWHIARGCSTVGWVAHYTDRRSPSSPSCLTTMLTSLKVTAGRCTPCCGARIFILPRIGYALRRYTPMLKSPLFRPPSLIFWAHRVWRQGGPSTIAVPSTGACVSASSCSGVWTCASCNPKNSCRVAALPSSLKAYLNPSSASKYGILRKFPISPRSKKSLFVWGKSHCRRTLSHWQGVVAWTAWSLRSPTRCKIKSSVRLPDLERHTTRGILRGESFPQALCGQAGIHRYQYNPIYRSRLR
jgi:hypothetical protein